MDELVIAVVHYYYHYNIIKQSRKVVILKKTARRRTLNKLRLFTFARLTHHQQDRLAESPQSHVMSDKSVLLWS